MDVNLLAYLSSIFIGFALSFETTGSVGRIYGTFSGQPSYGYSLHVRIATLGRVFTFVGLPIMGYIIDVTGDPKVILGIGFGAAASHSVFTAFFTISRFRLLGFVSTPLKNMINQLDYNRKIYFGKIFYFSMASILMQLSGIIFINGAAAELHDYRAALIQTAPLITALGTALHTFVVDPKLSKLADSSLDESYYGIQQYIFGRIFGTILIAIFLMLIY